jgi:hypothetical protein
MPVPPQLLLALLTNPLVDQTLIDSRMAQAEMKPCQKV